LWNDQETHEGRLNPTTFNGLILQFSDIRPITSVTINWANINIDENTVLSLNVNAPAAAEESPAAPQRRPDPESKEPAPAKR
jgi:hypothetical protein